MKQITKTNYDYGIYLIQKQPLHFGLLKKRVQIAKDLHAPGGNRDFSIALEGEPTTCYMQVQDNEEYQQSLLVGRIFELESEDQEGLDGKVKGFNPSHLISLKVNSGEDPKNEHSRAYQKMIQYRDDIYRELVGPLGYQLLKAILLHNKAAEKNSITHKTKNNITGNNKQPIA